ncbi:GntR family transcriptional regulator [Dactylosporangium sp. CA-233914]|uniref:GntR family transcriptional regulator n=1 Tax=Dactylosporangium sp. CA-233914 TaxID=3239934 RepID=UPI003D8ACD71
MTSNLDVPFARTSLREEVYKRVRNALLSGELTSRDRITESSLSERLGTSRAPVREALRQLQQEGLIEQLGTRGYQVVTTPDVREISLLRIALEKLAVTLVIDRGTPQDLSDLRAIVDRMRDAVQSGDAHQARELDIEFHERMCQAGRHDLLMATWNSMRAQLTLATLAVNRSYADPEGLPERHLRIIEVLESGNHADAEREIATHISTGVESFVGRSD